MGACSSRRAEIWFRHSVVAFASGTYDRSDWSDLKRKLSSRLGIPLDKLTMSCRTANNKLCSSTDDIVRVYVNMGATHIFVGEDGE
jgi:hypothetical protein